ncbi:MAG: hypothetical protein ABIA66_02665 [Candidatus Omnitrophota bacterium]
MTIPSNSANKVKLLACLGLILIFSSAAQGADIFSLSYSLSEGGYQLELSPTSQYKGVRITVTSNTAKRYEVVQRVLTPFENRDSPGSIIRDNFVMRGLRDAARGTFHVPTNDMPVRSYEVLYTSDAAGDQDTFTLVYGLVDIDRLLPGRYYGRISLTLQPIGSVMAQDTKFLDVYINISDTEGVKPTIEIGTSTGSNTLTLSSRIGDPQAAAVMVKINGVFRSPFSIVQALARPIESVEGNQINFGAVNFKIEDADKGQAPKQVIPLSSQPQVIYSSEPSGEADESFIIDYALGDLADLKAGRYSSNIQYFLEEAGVMRKSLGAVKLEIENESSFELVVLPQDEKGVLEFLNLKPGESPKRSAVELRVKTNIGRQYQVSQNAYSELTNKEGNVIPKKYFTLRTESLDTKGTLKIPKKQEISKGETVLFISDETGSSDKFSAVYELTPPEDIKAGNYSTRIVYSLSEI